MNLSLNARVNSRLILRCKAFALCFVLNLSCFANAQAVDTVVTKDAKETIELTASEQEIISKLGLSTSLPASPSNHVADKTEAAALGLRIFYDNRFSKAGSGISCASCHHPETAFTERNAFSHTLAPVDRNASDLINSARYQKWFFWDGRTNNLWSAPLFTLENEKEMGSTRLQVAHVVTNIYGRRYQAVFGHLPDLKDPKKFPPAGKPGDESFDKMTDENKKIVNTIYANVGKSLEAYLRKLAAGLSPFDDFVSGHRPTLTAREQNGLKKFLKYDCLSCHSGSTFTDEKFHLISELKKNEFSRKEGLTISKASIFSTSGTYSDASLGSKKETLATEPPSLESEQGFRTPTLRNVALTSPYGHDGRWKTLEEAIQGHDEKLTLKKNVSKEDMKDLVAFLKSLSGRQPVAPWNYWPGGR